MPDRISPRATWAALAFFGGAWFIVDALAIAPDFGHTDIYYFKDSGINFAEGLGLTTRFSYGNPSFEYRDYAQYPPLYPLLFGWFEKAVGVSARSNQAFNSLVTVLTGMVGFLAVHPLMVGAFRPAWRGGANIAVAFGSIVVGYYALAHDRPDGLAVAFGTGALLLAISGVSSASAAAAGTLSALALFTSPFTGCWTASAMLIGLVYAGGDGWRSRLPRLGIVAGAGTVTLLAFLAALRTWLPGWFQEFLGVATGSKTHNETGTGYFLALLHGDVRTWWSGFGYAGPESALPLVKLGAVAAALLWTVVTDVRRSDSRGHGARVSLLVTAPACLIVAPYQTNYALITAALLLAAWALVETAVQQDSPAGRRRAGVAVVIAFCINVALTVPFEGRNLIIRVCARDSLARAVNYLESHRGELESSGSYAAVSPTNYILWREAGLHPLISIYSGFRNEADRREVAVLALPFPGSGEMTQPQTAEFFPMHEYESVFRPLVPQPATLFAYPVSRSSQTWESAIYRRRN